MRLFFLPEKKKFYLFLKKSENDGYKSRSNQYYYKNKNNNAHL